MSNTFFAAKRKLRVVEGIGEEGRTVVSVSEDNTIHSIMEDILPISDTKSIFQIRFYGKSVFSVSHYIDLVAMSEFVGFDDWPRCLHGYHVYKMLLTRGSFLYG